MRYIEPGGDIDISLTYPSSPDLGVNDTVSFSLELLVRTASQTPGGDPTAPERASLPFRSVLIARK